MVHAVPPAPIHPAGATLATWLESPYNRWSLHHVEDLVATTPVLKGCGSVRVFGGTPDHLERFRPEFDLSAGSDPLQNRLGIPRPHPDVTDG